MCGIAGSFNLNFEPIPNLRRHLAVMNHLQQHRGPDGQGIWIHDHGQVGFGHRRLSIIDLNAGQQPMRDEAGNWLTYNGEIYNYIELRQSLGSHQFITTSDTEVLLHAYRRWGAECLHHFRGMFAFALWDEPNQMLFCARDRFGIKPFYYTIVEGTLYFSSEIKALLPFVKAIETDLDGFRDYLTYQFCLEGKTLYKGIYELLPGHFMKVGHGRLEIQRYWDVYYEPDFKHTPRYFEEHLQDLLEDSIKLHLRADVPLGAYVSGGLDSSIIAALASRHSSNPLMGFTGKFSYDAAYDESHFARQVSQSSGFDLAELDITAQDFIDHIQKVIYHLDYPVAGPGSFPQYMVSRLASRHRKVVLGGQGGDEIFGGYARYLIAYFEQCIKGAIDGTLTDGNYVVTYESIIPNLTALRNYKPLLQEFWREGLFEPMDQRYFRLINRAPSLGDEINWNILGDYSPYESFQGIFNGNNIRQEAYFDRMTHFDFKTLLPALLHVEDRVSMAHGIESRVPLLDHLLVEFAATIPADIKFKDGATKHILKTALGSVLPPAIQNRKDKMGFPVPLTEWVKDELREFVFDVFSSQRALSRDLVNNAAVLSNLDQDRKYGRKLWGLLSLELWQREFHDQAASYRALLNEGVLSA